MISRLNFRAWDKWDKRMRMPEMGDFIKWHALSNYADFLIIMQSTGLIDENGVEIFEGDILHSRVLDYEVVWCADEFNTGWKKKSGDSLTDIGQTLTDLLVVIGNIHENSELLDSVSEESLT